MSQPIVDKGLLFLLVENDVRSIHDKGHCRSLCMYLVIKLHHEHYELKSVHVLQLLNCFDEIRQDNCFYVKYLFVRCYVAVFFYFAFFIKN